LNHELGDLNNRLPLLLVEPAPEKAVTRVGKNSDKATMEILSRRRVHAMVMMVGEENNWWLNN
jgi:hypothetical protein